MSNILHFPGERGPDMTFTVERDFGQWCVVHRRSGKFVKRTFCSDQTAAEVLADALRWPKVGVPDSLLQTASYDDDDGGAA